jgi:uncharacterized membrane protein YedE/YeeE
LSPRAIAATATFMAAGFLTVFIIRHVIDDPALSQFLVRLLFGIGLCISCMIYPSKVLGFTGLVGAGGPSVAFVMGGAVAVAFVAFRVAAHRGASAANLSSCPPRKRSTRLIGGSANFGVGWGLVGLCPGPEIANPGFLLPRAALFVFCMILGMSLFWLLAGLPAPTPLAHAALDG